MQSEPCLVGSLKESSESAVRNNKKPSDTNSWLLEKMGHRWNDDDDDDNNNNNNNNRIRGCIQKFPD
jgi:hypothetical protein